MTGGKYLNLILMFVFTVIVILRIILPAYYRKDILNTVVLCINKLLVKTL